MLDPSTNTGSFRPAVAPSEARGFRLRVVSGPDAGAEAAPVDGRLTVGTAQDATLQLTDRAVSRYHLDLEGGAEGVCVRDIGSKNGTWLGSTLVT